MEYRYYICLSYCIRFLLGAVLSVPSLLSAQDISFKQLSTNDGLSQFSVYALQHA